MCRSMKLRLVFCCVPRCGHMYWLPVHPLSLMFPSLGHDITSLSLYYYICIRYQQKGGNTSKYVYMVCISLSLSLSLYLSPLSLSLFLLISIDNHLPCMSRCCSLSLLFVDTLKLLSEYFHICDQIWQNPAYCQNTHMAQCAFLASQVKKYRSPVFVIFMSKNLLTNCCHQLRRVDVSYQGEISLHFDLPSLYDCRTRSLLLWALIGIPASRLSRYS